MSLEVHVLTLFTGATHHTPECSSAHQQWPNERGVEVADCLTHTHTHARWLAEAISAWVKKCSCTHSRSSKNVRKPTGFRPRAVTAAKLEVISHSSSQPARPAAAVGDPHIGCQPALAPVLHMVPVSHATPERAAACRALQEFDHLPDGRRCAAATVQQEQECGNCART